MKAASVPLFAAFLVLRAVSAAAVEASDPASNPPLAAPSAPPPVAPPPVNPPDDTVLVNPDYTTATETWDTIKDYSYEKHADFIAGLTLIMKKVDAGILVLNAKRAHMTDEAAKDWDFNAKELNDARAYLQSMTAEAEKATDSTWPAAKDKVTQAWQRLRDAYDKVRHSTTS
ncbi:MAG TPA: hypothetical protein VG838_11350 [Opitutaceae bacterium]|nr:hypothetical protein [Opitutaceae bacterium]